VTKKSFAILALELREIIISCKTGIKIKNAFVFSKKGRERPEAFADAYGRTCK
jgi:hypothetical protein